MNIFLDNKLIDGLTIGQVITMMCRIKNPESKGWIEPKGQTLQRVDYPHLYELFNESEDNEFNKLIINEHSFRLPDWTARYLRNHGVANSSNNGGGGEPGLMYGDAIRNITGTINMFPIWESHSAGSFYYSNNKFAGINYNQNQYALPSTINMDVSKIVPTASENRVFTANVVYYIKAR